MVPLINVPEETACGWFLLVLEEKVPKLWGLAPLINDFHLIWSSLVLLEKLDVPVSFVHVLGQVAIRDVSSLPDVNRLRAFALMARLNNEYSSWV